MPTYAIDFEKGASKQLAALDSGTRVRITHAISKLAQDPRPAGVKRLQGYEGEALRLRVGDYRVVYKVQDARLIVVVVTVAHRRDVYR